MQFQRRYVSLELTTAALHITLNDEELKGDQRQIEKKKKTHGNSNKENSNKYAIDRVSRTIDTMDAIGAMCVQKHERWVLVVFLFCPKVGWVGFGLVCKK